MNSKVNYALQDKTLIDLKVIIKKNKRIVASASPPFLSELVSDHLNILALRTTEGTEPLPLFISVPTLQGRVFQRRVAVT